MFEASMPAAIGATMACQSDGAEASKPRRCRRLTLTKVDKRFRLGRRIAELAAIFTSALPADEMTPMKRLRVDEAAQLKALAEKARGDYLRDGAGGLDDILRIERKADQAVRALGIERASASASSPSSVAAPPVHDLTQLSNGQLDRLYNLLAGARPEEATEARQSREVGEGARRECDGRQRRPLHSASLV